MRHEMALRRREAGWRSGRRNEDGEEAFRSSFTARVLRWEEKQDRFQGGRGDKQNDDGSRTGNCQEQEEDRVSGRSICDRSGGGEEVESEGQEGRKGIKEEGRSKSAGIEGDQKVQKGSQTSKQINTRRGARVNESAEKVAAKARREARSGVRRDELVMRRMNMVQMLLLASMDAQQELSIHAHIQLQSREEAVGWGRLELLEELGSAPSTGEPCQKYKACNYYTDFVIRFSPSFAFCVFRLGQEVRVADAHSPVFSATAMKSRPQHLDYVATVKEPRANNNGRVDSRARSWTDYGRKSTRMLYMPTDIN
eukprot:6191860-Pleurochrysis_carterae.AAC.2